MSAIAFMVVRIDLADHNAKAARQRAETLQQLSDVASRLEYNINSNVRLVEGLAATVSTMPDMDQAEFERLGEGLFKSRSELRNIAAAPDLVVRLIYPVAPNLKSLGLNYRTDEAQREAVLKAQNSETIVITGPVALVQGGIGLIARYPVFTSQGAGPRKFWGIVSAVMDIDQLYRDSGIDANALPFDLAIAHDATHSFTNVFFGDASIFGRSPVTHDINLGYETWTLAATPKSGWVRFSTKLNLSRIYSLLVLLLVVGPLAWVGQLMRQRHKHIMALKEREEKLEVLSHRHRLALEASKIGVWEFDETTGSLIWDERMKELYGLPPTKASAEYSDWVEALHPDDLAAAERAFAEALVRETNYRTKFRIVLETGEVRHIRAYGITYRSLSGSKRIVGANWDVSYDIRMQEELREAHEQAELQNLRLAEASKTLEHQADHDALTGLPNRRYLDQYLDRHGPGSPHVLLHVDLDHFKEINDTYGHAAGDEVLRMSAARLLDVLGEGEFAARIGGDEFVVVASSDDPEARSRALTTRIHEAFKAPVLGDSFECRLGASIGAATDPGSGIRQLLTNADIALYEAKKKGRNRVEFFSDSLRLSAMEAKETADALLLAVETGDFEPFFQPQFDAVSHEIVGVEALARWRHPTRGLLTPDKFLSAAAHLNRVADIDAIILEKALVEAARWEVRGLHVPKLSVNVSALRLRDENLIAKLSALKMPASSLSFELLESISFDSRDEVLIAAINGIKALGINVEIDDFGSGHASISSLVELSPHRLKIDRKLITPMISSLAQQRLVGSIIEIGRGMGIEIIAEGVETQMHARLLRELGCHALQGYAFAKPMSGDDFIAFLSAAKYGPKARRKAVA